MKTAYYVKTLFTSPSKLGTVIIPCQYIGKDTKSTLIGTVAIVGLRTIVEAMRDTHVADKKDRYASTEEYLNACVMAAKDTTRQAEAYNKRVRANIKALFPLDVEKQLKVKD